MALLFTIYGQINMELNTKLLYLNQILLMFPLVLSLFVYEIEKKRDKIEITEILSTVIKISLFSYLLYIPLSIIASIRIPIEDFLMKLPSLIAHWIMDSFLYILIIILATIFSFVILWLKRRANKRKL